MFCCIQKTLPMWLGFGFGACTGFVALGTFSLLLLLVKDCFGIANSENARPDHPANDPLYCCVYYTTNALCLGKGPCLNVNASDVHLPFGTEGDIIPEITKHHLSLNPNFKLTIVLVMVIFIVECFIVAAFLVILKSIDSGRGLFMDVTISYDTYSYQPPGENFQVWQPTNKGFGRPPLERGRKINIVGSNNKEDNGDDLDGDNDGDDSDGDDNKDERLQTIGGFQRRTTTKTTQFVESMKDPEMRNKGRSESPSKTKSKRAHSKYLQPPFTNPFIWCKDCGVDLVRRFLEICYLIIKYGKIMFGTTSAEANRNKKDNVEDVADPSGNNDSVEDERIQQLRLLRQQHQQHLQDQQQVQQKHHLKQQQQQQQQQQHQRQVLQHQYSQQQQLQQQYYNTNRPHQYKYDEFSSKFG